MRGKRLEVLLLFVILLCAIFVLIGCKNLSPVESIEIKDGEEIVVPMGEFSYEGRNIVVKYANGTSEEVALTEDMIPEIERLKFFKYGDQEIKVIYDERYSTIMKVKVVRKTFDDIYELEGYSCVYDGQPHKIELNHELPEGATADYIYGNTFTNVGAYDVVCVISKEGVESKTLKAKLVIEPAQRDESQITFENTTTTYTGEPIYIRATNVPDGVDVSYAIYNDQSSIKINSAVNVGRYKFVARFSDTNENYKKIEDKEAYLTIEKAQYDMSTVILENQEKTYDGQTFTPAFSAGTVLPEGVSASFKCLDKNGEVVANNANAGVYTIVASFTGNETNYLPIDPMQATLTVNKRVIAVENVVTFESQSISFDRQPHSLYVENVPTTVKVEYVNNEKTYAGEYEVVAKFTAKSENETVDVDSMTAYLIINKVKEHVEGIDNIVPEDAFAFIYDDQNRRIGIDINGIDQEVYEITYFAFYKPDETVLQADEDFVPGTTYTFEIVFKFIDENVNNSVILAQASGTFAVPAAVPIP